MRLMDFMGRLMLWTVLTVAVVALVGGIINWRIDTFLIGVFLLIVSALFYVDEQKERGKNKNNNLKF